MATGFDLFDDFELQGYWWLPEKEDRKVAGTLTRRNQEMSLNLLDALIEQPMADMLVVRPPPRPEIILGWLDTGEVCTLYKNFETGSTFGFSGFRKSEFSPQMLFLGKHFHSPSDFTFDSLTVSHTHMEEWLTYNPFGAAWPRMDGIQITAEAKYASFPTQTIDIPQVDAIVALEPFFSSKHDLRRHEWHHTVNVRLTLRSDQTLDRYLSVLTDCRNLFTLFVGEAVVARSIVAYQERPPAEEEEAMPPDTVRLHFSQRQQPTSKRVSWTDMLVTYPAVKDRLDDVIRNWLTKADKLRTVSELYFGTLYNKALYLRFHLLSLAQALETYSRLRLHPDDNQGFRARLQEILDSLQPDTVKLVCRDKGYFAEMVVDTRDYFTHYLDKHKVKSPQGADLYMLTERLRLLVTVLLLKEVGLDESLISGLLCKHPKLMQWLTPHPARPAAPAAPPGPLKRGSS